MPGVGPVLISSLVAELPELGTLNRRQSRPWWESHPSTTIALHPWARDLGAAGAPGNSLYMSAVSGVRFNATIREFYKHLRERGKAPKVAMVACMRKLLLILNAILKTQQPWRSPRRNANVLRPNREKVYVWESCGCSRVK